MDITITLTDAEAKALSYVSLDPQEWVENMVKERARIAVEEIFVNEVQRMIADPEITEIPADRETVVLAASIKSLAEQQTSFPSNTADTI